MRSYFVVPALAVGLLAAPAWAEETAAMPQQGMRPAPGAMMMKADTDGDGAVSREEFLKQAAERAEARFKALDKNSDGKLTPDERPQRPEGGWRRRGGEPGMPPPPGMGAPPAGAPPVEAPPASGEE